MGWGFHTLRGGTDLGDLRFRPRVVGVVDIFANFLPGDGKLSFPGAAGAQRYTEGQLSLRAGSMSPSHSAITQLGWGFHTLRGGTDPGDIRFVPRIVGVVDILANFLPADGKLSSPGAAGAQRYPEGQLSLRAGSMSPRLSLIHI